MNVNIGGGGRGWGAGMEAELPRDWSAGPLFFSWYDSHPPGT